MDDEPFQIALGGLLRCCIQTIELANGKSKDDRLQCPHCRSWMIMDIDRTWHWDSNAAEAMAT
jgi:hypothetical protein